MSVYDFNETQILLFFAALVRVSCLLLVLPIFGHQSIPAPAKILLSFSLTLILFPLANVQGNIDPKAQETLNGRVHACWLNPGLPPTQPVAAQAPAAAADGTTAR